MIQYLGHFPSYFMPIEASGNVLITWHPIPGPHPIPPGGAPIGAPIGGAGAIGFTCRFATPLPFPIGSMGLVYLPTVG